MISPPSPEEILEKFLFKVMSEEEATRFSNLKEVLVACEEAEPKWQAVYALSVHLFLIAHLSPTAEFNGYTEQQRAQISDSKYISDIWKRSWESKKIDIDGAPFFLASLMLGQFCCWKGQEDQREDQMDAGKGFLKLAMTTSEEGKGHPFVAYGRLLAANTLKPIFLKEANHKAAVEAMTKVAEGLPTEEIFSQLDELADIWLHHCESIPVEQYTEYTDIYLMFEKYIPEGSAEAQWVDLLDRVASIATIAEELTKEASQRCREVSSIQTEEASQRCLESQSLREAKNSEDFWAWKFGYIVGRLTTRVSKEILMDMCNPRLMGHGDWPIGAVAASLIAGCASDKWDYYWTMWICRSGDSGLDLTDVSPTSGLYWAMRMGFDEAIRREATAAVSPIPSIKKVEDIVTSSAIRHIRHDEITTKKFDEMGETLGSVPPLLNEILRRLGSLPPSPEEIRQWLEDSLSPEIFTRLPLEVQDYLVKAERAFQGKTNLADSKLDFVRAVEAMLDSFFIHPMQHYYGKHGKQWPYKNMGLRDWGELFCKVARTYTQFSNVNLDEPNIHLFFKKFCPKADNKKLTELGEALQEVQRLRSGSAHFQHHTEFMLQKEEQQLEGLREMVLGLKGPSVIRQMFELFSPPTPTTGQESKP